ncbi:MAG: hypothetical protein ABIG87_02835 [Patescibacteria group bacterium]
MEKFAKTIKLFLGISIVFFVCLLSIAHANIFDIEYPVAELGNCGSQEECKIFCNQEQNQLVCVKFAESKGAIPKERASQMKNDLERFERKMEEFGPGQCTTPRECDAYCRVLENLDECLNYGVMHGYQTQMEADKIREQAQKGGPGNCKSKEECDNFCKNPENAQECFKFVVAEGKITQEEADFMADRMKTMNQKPQKKEPKIDKEKMKNILEIDGGPGGCKTLKGCDAYCGGFGHGEECFNFALKNNLLPENEIEMVKKMSSLKSGPGGCMNDKECDEFCSKSENQEMCMNFMKDNKLITDEEIKMMEQERQIMKKMDGPLGPGGLGGPGGCKTPEECDAYCGNPANVEECINFAGGQSGMIKKRTVDNMMGQTQEARDKMRRMEEEKMKFENENRDEMPYQDDGRQRIMPMNMNDGQFSDMIRPRTDGAGYFQNEPYRQYNPQGDDGQNMYNDNNTMPMKDGMLNSFIKNDGGDMNMTEQIMDNNRMMEQNIMERKPSEFDSTMRENFEIITPEQKEQMFKQMPQEKISYPIMEQMREGELNGEINSVDNFESSQTNPVNIMGAIIIPFLQGFAR